MYDFARFWWHEIDATGITKLKDLLPGRDLGNDAKEESKLEQHLVGVTVPKRTALSSETSSPMRYLLYY